MSKKFKANKKSLNMQQNLKSWNRGTRQKLIAQPSNKIATASRNGIILT